MSPSDDSGSSLSDDSLMPKDDEQPVEEKFGAKEEEETSVSSSSELNVGQGYANRQFRKLKLSNGISYSLTKHKIKKPREFLLYKQDYLVADQDLYQVYEDYPLPELQPGFSYTRLRNSEIRVVKFVPQPASSLLDRTLYMPEVTPRRVKIGEFKHFASVFEPLGEDVEVYGVVLSFYTIYLMQSSVNSNLVVPYHLKVERPNVVSGQKFYHCLCYAYKQINPYLAITIADIADVQINQLIYQLFKAKNEEAIIDFLRQRCKQVTSVETEEIEERYIIRKVIQEEKHIVAAIEEYQKLYLRCLIKLSQKTEDAMAVQLLQRIFRTAGALPNFASIVCADSKLSSKTIAEAYKADCKIQTILSETERELQLNLQRSSGTNVGASYIDVLPYAQCCKNENFVRFVLTKQSIFNTQQRELMKTAQIKNLREKDIKCVCSVKAMMAGKISPLQVAGFFDSKGLLEKADKSNFTEFIEEAKKKTQGKSRGFSKYPSKKIELQVVYDILFACACNINDNVNWIKLLMAKFQDTEIDRDRLLTAALVSMNRKIFAYLSLQQDLKQQFIFTSAKYLLTQYHAKMIKELGICTVESIKNLSFILSDDDMYGVLSQAVLNGTFRLYNNDLLEKMILGRKLRTTNLILQSGYSFPNSRFDYKQLTAIYSVYYVMQVIDVIAEYYEDCANFSIRECLGNIVCGCIVNQNVELLKALCSAYKAAISHDFIVEQRSSIVYAVQSFVQAQHITNCDQVFQFIVELSDVLQDKLLDGHSIQVLQLFIFDSSNCESIEVLSQVCDEYDAILAELDSRCYWYCCLALKLIGKMEIKQNCNLSGISSYICRMAGEMYSHEQSISLMNNRQISNLTPIHLQTVDFILPHEVLYTQAYNDRDLQEIVAMNCWKFTTQQQMDFLLNMTVRSYESQPISQNGDVTLFQELSNIINAAKGQPVTSVVYKAGRQFNTLQFLTVNTNYQLFSLIVQTYEKYLCQKINDAPIIYYITYTIKLQTSAREYLQMIRNSFKGEARFMAILGLVLHNQAFCLDIVKALYSAEADECCDFLAHESNQGPIFHYIIDILSSIAQNDTKTPATLALTKMLSKKHLGRLVILRDSTGQTAFVKHIEKLCNIQALDFKLAGDDVCNVNGENCLHLALLKFKTEMRKTANLGRCSAGFGIQALGANNNSLDLQKYVLEAIEQKRLGVLLNQFSKSGFSPVHHISSLEAMKFALKHVDIKTIDKKMSIFKLHSVPDINMIYFLLNAGCNVLTELNPVPKHDKLFENYDYLATIVKECGQQCLYALVYQKLVGEEIVIYHVLAYGAAIVQHYQDFLENAKICEKQRTAQLYMRYICSVYYEKVLALQRSGIKLGIYRHSDLMALVSEIRNPQVFFYLYELGDLELSETEFGKAVALALTGGTFNWTLPLVQRFITAENASFAVSKIARSIILGRINQPLYSLLKYVQDNFMSQLTDAAIHDMAGAFIITDPPAKNQTDHLISKLVASKFFEQISSERIQAYSFENSTLLDVFENAPIKTVEDTLVDEFVQRLRMLNITTKPYPVLELPNVRFMETVNHFPELSEKYKTEIKKPMKMNANSSLKSNYFKVDCHQELFYKDQKLSVFGIQEQFNFRFLKCSILFARVVVDGKKFALETSYNNIKSENHLWKVNPYFKTKREQFDTVFQAFDAFRKYIRNKSGYEYEYVLAQDLDATQFPGKFKFFTRAQHLSGNTNQHENLVNQLSSMTSSILQQSGLSDQQNELLYFIFGQMLIPEEMLPAIFEDCAKIQEMTSHQLYNHLLRTYNVLVSQRVLKDFRQQVILHLHHFQAAFALFSNVFQFVTYTPKFTFEYFLERCGIRLGSKIISLPNETKMRCITEFPQLHLGGTFSINSLMRKYHSAVLARGRRNYIYLPQSNEFCGFILQYPCTYIGGSRDTNRYRVTQYVVKDGKISRVSAPYERDQFAVPYDTVVPAWVTEDEALDV